MGGAGLGTIDGAKLGLQEPLYRWLYGSYEKRDLITSDFISGSYTESNEQSSHWCYTLTINEDNSYTLSDAEQAYISVSGWLNVPTGKYLKAFYISGIGLVLGKLQALASDRRTSTNIYINENKIEVYYSKPMISGYYLYTNAHWTQQDGYILNRNKDAYPNGDYQGNIYYSYPKQISP